MPWAQSTDIALVKSLFSQRQSDGDRRCMLQDTIRWIVQAMPHRPIDASQSLRSDRLQFSGGRCTFRFGVASCESWQSLMSTRFLLLSVPNLSTQAVNTSLPTETFNPYTAAGFPFFNGKNNKFNKSAWHVALWTCIPEGRTDCIRMKQCPCMRNHQRGTFLEQYQEHHALATTAVARLLAMATEERVVVSLQDMAKLIPRMFHLTLRHKQLLGRVETSWSWR